MVINLDSAWRLALDPDNQGREQQWWQEPRPEAVPAAVPWPIQGIFPGKHGVAWYWREFTTPTHPWPGGRFLLRFWSVDYLAQVWVNGVAIGGHEGGETPFVLDATAAVRPGQTNLVAVRVLNPVNEPIDGVVLGETPHRNKFVPHRTGGSYNYGGILESVELLVVAATWLEDLYVRANPRTGTVRARLTIRNDAGRPVTGRLTVSLAPAATGETLIQTSRAVTLAPGDSGLEIGQQLDGFRPWELTDPFLYRVTARLETAEPAGEDERSVRCGFRDLRVERGYFRLNGRRIFLRSTHTGNHCPVGQIIAPPSAPDLLRRDLLFAKACGYNMVRFIAGIGHPFQLDLCDELGLMVYEESLAGWCLGDSPKMAARFDLSTREMVRRDRNHPSVTVWGLLNETQEGPIFRQALASLPLVRGLDDSRLVLLSSGRWDGQWGIGSVSNPDNDQWEHVWGSEAPGAPPCAGEGTFIPAYKPGGGDVHMYPSVPQSAEVDDFIRTVGHDSRPVLLSEYGIGSLMNAIRELRWYEQSGLPRQAEDAVLMRSMAESLVADWERFGLEGVYPFPEDMLRDSQRLHARQRTLGFDLIRSNPKICGYNLTGMLDHGMTGEGVWTFWREWKPAAFDALSDGWAPLRWCLFSRPLHQYLGRPLALEAVLANEDVLAPGNYPACFRLVGPAGIVWQRRTWLHLPTPAAGEDPPLAVRAVRADVTPDGPEGRYEFAANVEEGAAPTGGRLGIYLSRPIERVRLPIPVTTWGIAPEVEEWLRDRGVTCQPMNEEPPAGREVILVGQANEHAGNLAGWQRLTSRVDRGSVAIFADPAAFRRTRALVGAVELSGVMFPNVASIPIENAPESEWPVFQSEVLGDLVFDLTGLPEAEYTLELGMCELTFGGPDERLFDLDLNGRRVLERFDLFRETGGRFRALSRRFPVRPESGRIKVQFTSRRNLATVSRLRLYDATGRLVIESDYPGRERDRVGWLPLAPKGQCNEIWDWLYHKECVAKRHPVFADLPAGGILDWDYYGSVIPKRLFTGQATPDEVVAAAFAVGY
ncbi:MAG: sugar-binding domain-containing protein, partial [Candidatus Latescibacterota bacterium]